jgi:hypothetical protein
VRYQATTERLKTKEAAAKAGASTQEIAGVGDATREPEPVEEALGGARLDMPSFGGLKPRSTVRTQATVEAIEAEASVHDAGRADVEESREVVEASLDAGKRRSSRSRNRRGRSHGCSRNRTSQRSRRPRRNGGWSCHRATCRRWRQ